MLYLWPADGHSSVREGAPLTDRSIHLPIFPHSFSPLISSRLSTCLHTYRGHPCIPNSSIAATCYDKPFFNRIRREYESRHKHKTIKWFREYSKYWWSYYAVFSWNVMMVFYSTHYVGSVVTRRVKILITHIKVSNFKYNIEYTYVLLKPISLRYKIQFGVRKISLCILLSYMMYDR